MSLDFGERDRGNEKPCGESRRRAMFLLRESGREDLNLRPPGPEPGALTGLRYAPRLRKLEADETEGKPRALAPLSDA